MSFWWFVIGFFVLACVIFLAMVLSDFPPDDWGSGDDSETVMICMLAVCT